MSYRDSINEDLNGIKNDVEGIKDELENILDMDSKDEIKISISETISTIGELLRELD